jgi:hypothetical protein
MGGTDIELKLCVRKTRSFPIPMLWSGSHERYGRCSVETSSLPAGQPAETEVRWMSALDRLLVGRWASQEPSLGYLHNDESA